MRNQVQLVTYVDRLAGDLAGLRRLLDGPLAGLFGGVHVLPFFTPYDGADAGFDPIDHTSVDPRLGGWSDVAALGEDRDLVVELIVNHVSARSPQFRDWVAKGTSSEYDGMFLTFGDVFADGASEGELLAIYRPRPGLPFTSVRIGHGRRLVWTTFTTDQVDIDVGNSVARAYLTTVLEKLAQVGVAMVRMDAVGYAVKTAGTSSFMTAETFDFIDDLTAQARGLGLAVLVEVHAHYLKQIEIAGRVDWVYDFALPPLLLHALFSAETGPLQRWLAMRPDNAITVLDTHDGIGVIDVGPDQTDRSLTGLLGPEQVDLLVETVHANTGGHSRAASGKAASNLDLYQVNSTYYDALGGDDDRYLLARAVQFFTPGIPQVYYVGLFAGRNDTDLLARTGVGRDINRHYYDENEVEAALHQPVVERLCELIRLRNIHPAFAGNLTVDNPGDGVLVLRRRHGEHWASLTADFRSGKTHHRGIRQWIR